VSAIAAGQWLVPALTTQQGTWYLTRSTGVVAMLLLTASLVLGIVEVERISSTTWPRFAIDALHRYVSLLALAVVVVHVLTTVLNTFTSIGIAEAFLPLMSSYRSVWLGLGAAAFDLMIAVTVTGMLRKRLPPQGWRLVHLLSYLCWPLALLHGLATGSDATSAWMIAVSLLCLASVLAAVGVRLRRRTPPGSAARVLALLAGAACLALFGLWLARGPLGSEWPRRAGTPRNLLQITERRHSGAD
jgi:sulfoxide reductase heme-binding subunit YedZ